ncbi:hypothetical protein SAMN05421543_105156 [Alicyclobacillus macrosporangiidus]|uniref:Uncharacterized protein n=1 Tax=Alicyclobacillus macrosporangiidus TaxID=392015 RepID=A0A1I7HXI5_9BACL|nr:hypothetical protein SAMN05421543_105156 [Alicyclobacillus macrosporangiidus]
MKSTRQNHLYHFSLPYRHLASTNIHACNECGFILRIDSHIREGVPLSFSRPRTVRKDDWRGRRRPRGVSVQGRRMAIRLRSRCASWAVRLHPGPSGHLSSPRGWQTDRPCAGQPGRPPRAKGTAFGRIFGLWKALRRRIHGFGGHVRPGFRTKSRGFRISSCDIVRFSGQNTGSDVVQAGGNPAFTSAIRLMSPQRCRGKRSRAVPQPLLPHAATHPLTATPATS